MNSATENSTTSTRTETRTGLDQELLLKGLSNPEMATPLTTLSRQLPVCRRNIVIRTFGGNDLFAVMQIWLDANMKAHSFIPKDYWTDNYAMVKDILPQAEIYVYEDSDTNQVNGFIGLTDNYIEGIFVREGLQSSGIGKQLLDYVKEIKSSMRLSVYQKNTRAIAFYQREQFVIRSESIDNSTNEKEFIMNWSK